jgi:hypothetical protein
VPPGALRRAGARGKADRQRGQGEDPGGFLH